MQKHTMKQHITALFLAAAMGLAPAIHAAPNSPNSAAAQVQSPVPNNMPETMLRRVAMAAAMLQRGQAERAMPELNRLVAETDAIFKRDTKNRIFAADDSKRVLAILLDAANHNQSTIVVSAEWIAPLYLRAYAHTELGQFNAARADLNRALAISPLNPRVLGERAQLDMRQKNFAPAEADLNKMRELGKLTDNPRMAVEYQGFALRGLGYIAVERKQWDKALNFYREALKLNPQDAKAEAEIDYIRQNRTK